MTIPKPVLEFIEEHIHSAEQLAVLLLLHRGPVKSWTADAVAAELRTSKYSAEMRLGDLQARGIVQSTPDGFYSFAPADEDTANRVAALSELCRDRLPTIISLIFSRPVNPESQFDERFRPKQPGQG
jgi:hypothetical protein